MTQEVRMDEEFVSRAAPLLRRSVYAVDSVIDAVTADDLTLLWEASCNDDRLLCSGDRVVRFDDHQELHRVLALFVQAYRDDRYVERVSYSRGAERIDFHDGTAILFRVQPYGPRC